MMPMPRPDTGGPSTNPIKDKTHVLYVLPENPTCQQAIRMCQSLAVHVQDVRKIQRPPWLRGVPTLIHLRDKIPIVGTDCLRLLKSMADCIPKGAPSYGAGGGGGIGYAIDDDGPDPSLFGSVMSVNRSQVDTRYAPQGTKVSEEDMQRYVRAREKQDQQKQGTPVINRI